MWRLCKLGYSHEPRMVLVVVLLTLVVGIPDALFALWLNLLGNAVIARDTTTIWIVLGLMTVSATMTWLLTVLNARLTRRFRDRVTVALETHVATLQASVTGLEHQERSDYLDRLEVLRTQIFVLDHMYASVLNTLGWLVRLANHPDAAGLHPSGASVVGGIRRADGRQLGPPPGGGTPDRGAMCPARPARRALLPPGHRPRGGKVRVTGIAPSWPPTRRQEWRRWFFPIARARWVTAASLSGAWAVFALAYVGAVVFVVAGLRHQWDRSCSFWRRAQLSAYVGATIGEIGFLRGIWMDGARRLAWLEDYADSLTAQSDVEVPSADPRDRTQSGELSLSRHRATGPGRHHAAPSSRSVVAIVGENGAGSRTLIKLLTKMYEPSSGEVLVDGRPLRRMPADEWRARVTGAFQDFYRFEFTAQRSVGLGDLPRLDDEPQCLGPSAGPARPMWWNDFPRAAKPTGSDLARRTRTELRSMAETGAVPRLHARGTPTDGLDEPTAALDAETEHALFDSFAEAARSTAVGGITILVSHRFSTVRMADLDHRPRRLAAR